MTSIQWDSQQFYQPPRPVVIPPSTFWPPSHPQQGVGSTHSQPSTASANFEGIKRTITHDAAQMHMSSSSDHAELPLNQRQRQSLPGTGETMQSIRYSGDADVSDAETEFPSIEELLLPDINGSLSSVRGDGTGSDKLKWGTSQDEPILLDSDVGHSGVLDDAEREILVDLSGSQAALSDVAIQTTTTKVNDVLLLASQNMSKLETEGLSGLGSVQETSAISVTEGIPTNEDKMDIYQPKSTRDSNDYISAENDHIDTIELSPGVKRSDDRDGSTDGTDGEDHSNDGSDSDIEHPQRLKRRRRAKSTDSSAQTNFTNVKDVTFSTDSWDVLSQGGTAVSFDIPPKSQFINGGDHVNDSDTAGSEIQERRLKRPRRAKSTESSGHMSPSNVKEAFFATANSSEVSTPKTGATSSDSPLESHEIPIRGSLTLQTFQSGIVYCLKFYQELPFPLDIEQAQDVISSASSGDRDRERPHLRERVVSRPGRHSTYSKDDNKLLIQLKEKDKLPWDEIAEYFPERTKGTLQVHYCTKLKNSSQTSKCKKRKITNSAKESGKRYPSRFSMDLLDPQLQDALPPSTSTLPATADSIEDAHGSIVSTTPGNIERTEVQQLCSSQGVESNLVAIHATEGRWEVEALLAKSKVGSVIWYLVKWAGFRDEDNTWQKQDDISTDLINDFEASYQGNFGVELLKKRERRGKIEYFVKWKGRPTGENSWEKRDTIHSE
ncbi:hypothetical protein GMDG_08477 [Pseudogymnoascus destructans 20631-21]|uniref:Chromo domain-containing protein n=1 Tax=Pseudogymnoascus destructans (strain ATCC MYA-4855 / 20631-21) TaxID=658429 RepID=L8G352_PSED2|nr:hypothetical protein GMDG_08477 [Pseudogymnoascus destructans 20631-21]